MGIQDALRRCALVAAGVLTASCSESLRPDEIASRGSESAAPLIESAPPTALARPFSLPASKLRGDTPSSALALHIAYPAPPTPPPSAPAPPPAETALPAEEPQPEPPVRRKLFRKEKPIAKAVNSSTRRVRTTAYCRDEGDHFTFGSMSAVGKPLRLGAVRSAAADWSRYPAGTRFRIAGDHAVYEIDDYGSALVGTDTIDLYQPDVIAMEEWGVRHVDIEILRWGAPSRSLKILRSRAGTPHIDAMILALEGAESLGGHTHGG